MNTPWHRTILAIALFVVGPIGKADAQEMLSLAGKWSFQVDSLDQGLEQQWFLQHFNRFVTLPGTLDEAGVGKAPPLTTDTLSREVLMHLARKHTYVGPVWYAREVVIPQSWSDKQIELLLERVIWNTRVWVDGKEAGSGESLSAPHRFELSTLLKPGRHHLALRIDNRKQYDISHRDMAHAYTEGTQVIWNGVIGRLQLIAHDPAFIKMVQAYPSLSDQLVNLSVVLQNEGQQLRQTQLLLQVFFRDKQVASRQVSIQLPVGASIRKESLLIPGALPWDEFHHNLYRVEATLTGTQPRAKDRAVATFGMRDLTAREGLLQVNGRRVFLRGTLECAVFPLTGHPPMDKKGWRKVFATARAYGLNHIRFHSWCPPEAAFAVADSLGFYLQVELPFWSEKVNGAVLDESSRRFIEQEAERISEAYGNHPSFLLWSMGNEIRGDFAWLSRLVRQLKSKDPRHLYTSTTFTFEKGHGKQPEVVDDFFVTQYTEKGWVRGQGIFNTVAPDFTTDYRAAIDGLRVPIVSHEIGQYSIYPNLEEIKKYTGVLAPYNFEAIRRDLMRKGLLSLNNRFSQASGRFSAGLYKEEIERALKTRGMSGFQLLDLHDFPGQGTALVGILDAFWDSKGLVSPEEHRRYCSPVVPLLRFAKAAYSSGERFEATAEIANFSSDTLWRMQPRWTVSDAKGKVLFLGHLPVTDIPVGNGWELGAIAFDLKEIKQAAQLTVEVQLKGTNYRNQWTIWVYPQQLRVGESKVVFTTRLSEALACLAQGKKVLLDPDTAAIQGVEGRFAPVFWSPVHFPKQPGTMGILCDPAHPAFKHFPTAFHSDWQWWDLITTSRTMVLDSLPALVPVVRVVDNFFKNRRMATIIEARVGKGKLILTSMDLTHRLDERPAARQLRYSLEQYMASPAFAPHTILTPHNLQQLVAGSQHVP